MQAEDIRLEHKMVGNGFHVFTSPDVPGLYIAHRDRAIAEANIQPALDMLERMTERQREKHRIEQIKAENKLWPDIFKTMFICGYGTQAMPDRMPSHVQVCPAYGVDWATMYIHVDRYMELKNKIEELENCIKNTSQTT